MSYSSWRAKTKAHVPLQKIRGICNEIKFGFYIITSEKKMSLFFIKFDQKKKKKLNLKASNKCVKCTRGRPMMEFYGGEGGWESLKKMIILRNNQHEFNLVNQAIHFLLFNFFIRYPDVFENLKKN